MNLFLFSIESGAIIAKSIVACPRMPFVLRYVTTWRTCTVIVMNAIGRWFLPFVDGIECCCCWHRVRSFRGNYEWYGLYHQCE